VDYVEARSLSEACAALAEGGEGAKVTAGGVALGIMMRWGFLLPPRLVSIRYVGELRYIRLDDQRELRIGAATTHREVEQSALIREHAPVLAQMERRLASIQVRNAGTLCGNLCHGDSAADPGPVLLALGAKGVIASTRGTRVLPLREFFCGYLSTALAPDEILAEVRVPAAPPRSAAAYLKHITRNAVDFPFAGVAAQLALSADGRHCEAVRIAVGAVAPVAMLVEGAAVHLRGKPLGEALFREAGQLAADEVPATDDAAGSADYRKHLVQILTARALNQAWEGARVAALAG
jgi:carbon-monoxide dehydrogenase medium subunit